MKRFDLGTPRALVAALSLVGLALPAWAYDSGSTGADGAFSPTVNTEVQLPESGLFNFTTVNIPTGVTVTFRKNTTNTPVVILASGNVTIAGTINIGGGNAAQSGTAGDGNLGDDGVPGVGGPGGYDGGRGGQVGANNKGGSGLGPGGGRAEAVPGGSAIGGAGGSFGALGDDACNGTSSGCPQPTTTYGSSQLLPLIGGSGGGGGSGGVSFKGGGGGGGGGAILIASSGTVSLTGSILANGGNGGSNSSGSGYGANGGSGSGGGIRIVATTITGNGTLAANGGAEIGYFLNDGNVEGGAGGAGRIRLEAETFTRTAGSSPTHSFGSPGSVFVAGLPTLRITSVAGVAAPASPTGNADITLPSTTPNPVTVGFATTGVPVGNTVSLKVTPAYGATTTVVSPAITGSTSAGVASVGVTLPSGPSVLSASTTYTIVTAMGEALSIYAQGELVEKVRLSTALNGPTLVTLITTSGREFAAPHAALAMTGG